jgi:hypothetical protein
MLNYRFVVSRLMWFVYNILAPLAVIDNTSRFTFFFSRNRLLILYIIIDFFDQLLKKGNGSIWNPTPTLAFLKLFSF